MKIAILLMLVLALVVVTYAAKVRASSRPNGPNIKIFDIRLEPPSGSILNVQDPILVHFKYAYTKPDQRLFVWAKVLDEAYESTYQGSVDQMSPGSGDITRFVYLTQPGILNAIHIVVKDESFKEIFNQEIKVNYRYQRNQKLEALSGDGEGSKITSVALNPSHPQVLAAGTRVNVSIDYEINAAHGLDIWAIPDTKCNMSYEGTMGRLHGKGTVQKHFTINEACEIKRVQVVMRNVASEAVFSQFIDVDFKFVE